jgi:hypothetical protein
VYVADDGSRWRVPPVFHGSHAEEKNGSAASELRTDAHGCIMVRVFGPAGYKVAARFTRARKAGSPLIVVPTAISVPWCSKPSRCGLARAAHAERAGATANLDGSCARRCKHRAGQQRKKDARQNYLTTKAPYKETAVGERVLCRVLSAHFGFETVTTGR